MNTLNLMGMISNIIQLLLMDKLHDMAMTLLIDIIILMEAMIMDKVERQILYLPKFIEDRFKSSEIVEHYLSSNQYQIYFIFCFVLAIVK